MKRRNAINISFFIICVFVCTFVFMNPVYAEEQREYKLRGEAMKPGGAMESGGVMKPEGVKSTLVVAAGNAPLKDKWSADFVCKGNNDEITIQAAIKSLPASGGTIKFTKGTFKINNVLTLNIGNTAFVGTPGTTIFDCSKIKSDYYYILFTANANGYENWISPLTTKVENGLDKIVVSETKGYTAGDWIKLFDDESITGYKKGEILRIKSVDSGTILTVEGGVRDNYTVGNNAAIRKLRFLDNIAFSGIEFVGPGMGTKPALFGGYLLNHLSFTNCKIRDWGLSAIKIIDCLNSSVSNCLFENVYLYGWGYSICITNASENIDIEGCTFQKKGNYIACGASTGSYMNGGFPRNISISSNYFQDSVADAINTHEPFVGPIIISNNSFYNCREGIALFNAFSTIKDNVFKNCTNGITLVGDKERKSTISSNSFIDCVYSTKIEIDNVNFENNTSKNSQLIIRGHNNIVQGNSFYGTVAIDSNGLGRSGNIIFTNNRFNDVVGYYSFKLVNYQNLEIKNNYFLNSGMMALHKCRYVKIDNSSFENSLGIGICLYDAQDTRVTNNVVESARLPLYMDGATVPETEIVINGNQFKGGWPVSYSGYTNVLYENNT